MKKIKKEAEKLAMEIADEISDLVVNTRKTKEIYSTLEKIDNTQEKIKSDFDKLKKRMDVIERELQNLSGNVETNVIEIDRMISEKWRQSEDDRNQDIMGMLSQIQRLRDMMITIRTELKEMKSSAKLA